MYAAFFGLAREPFSIAPDPRFLFLSEQHREALAHLLFGVGGGGGFVLLTGEIGAGKTTVCRCFLQQVPPHCSVAYLFNPQFDATELLDAILEEFKVPPVATGAGFKARVDALNRYLLDQHAQGRAAVLVIDEAQGLAPPVLEQLRLLTNLETAERKLLQIILIGQPELRTLLKAPGLEQLAQRVIARYHLGPLDAGETAAYIRHRVLVAALPAEGAEIVNGPGRRVQPPLPPLPFDDAALAEVHRRTGGVPRRINVLCDRALLGAYSKNLARADASLVAQAAAEVFALDAASGPPAAASATARTADTAVARAWPWAAAAAAGLLGLGAWSWWVGGLSGSGTPASAPAPVATLPSAPASAIATASMGPASAASGAAASVLPAAPAASEARATTEPVLPRLDDGGEVLRRAWRSEGAAMAALAAAVAGDPPASTASGTLDCAALAPQQCWRGRQGWPGLQQADRAALLLLRTARGEPAWLLLGGLDAGLARVAGAGNDGSPRGPWVQVPLAVLAGLWRGEFVVLWTPPPGWTEADARATEPTGAWARWLDARLAEHVQAPPAAPLRDRVLAFQLAQELPADGRPGPLTLMRLQRLAEAERVPRLGPAGAGPIGPR
jgi:general secretion pathway protein A